MELTHGLSSHIDSKEGPGEIQMIRLPLPLRMGVVNCYLFKKDTNFVLIDTGVSINRKALVTQLENAGCKLGLLKLIILTHGDFDHTGNAAYLRKIFGSPIAMHRDDSGMAEFGDMFFNRGKANVLFRKLIPVITGFGKNEKFKPDILVGDEYDFSGFGFDARALSLPGHSKGSIGILTANGDLICGDLFENITKPAPNSIYDVDSVKASIDTLRNRGIRTVYPGHGEPFLMEDYLKSN